jgi:hypothetical protein
MAQPSPKCGILIFRRPNLKLNQMPIYIPNIDVVDCVKLLGVFVSSVFNQMVHVNFISGAANQRLYLLKILKQNGLNSKSLDCLFSAIIVSRITYAIEAWGSYVTMEQEGMINKMFKKGKKWGLTSKLYTLNDLKDGRSDNFFRKICQNSNHCLFHLMPPLREKNV